MAIDFIVQEHLLAGDSLEAKWAFATELGFGGIELRGAGGPGFAERLPELKAAARAGVAMPTVCVITNRFIGAFDPDHRAEAFETMKTLLSVISEIGGTGAITPAAYGLHSNYLPPFAPPREPEEDRKILIDMLGQLGDHAASAGVKVYFEPLNRYEDHMVNTLAQGASICRELGHDSVRLMADVFHMSIEEADLPAAVRDAADMIAHVHLADSNRRPPGQGHTDFASIFAALDTVGFDGVAAIECIVDDPPELAIPPAAATLMAARRA